MPWWRKILSIWKSAIEDRKVEPFAGSLQIAVELAMHARLPK